MLKFNKLLMKKQHDLESKFWSLDTKINDDQATLQIPAYFTYNKPRDNKNLEDSEQSSKPVEKPLIQPFDPRFTLAMYYYYLDQQMTMPITILLPLLGIQLQYLLIGMIS